MQSFWGALKSSALKEGRSRGVLMVYISVFYLAAKLALKLNITATLSVAGPNAECLVTCIHGD